MYGATQRQAMMFAFGDWQALIMRSQPALEDEVRLIIRVMRRDGSGYRAWARTMATVSAVVHVLVTTFIPGGRATAATDLVHEHGPRSKMSDRWIGRFAVNQHRMPIRFHPLQHRAATPVMVGERLMALVGRRPIEVWRRSTPFRNALLDFV